MFKYILLVMLMCNISFAEQEIEFYYGSIVSHLFDQEKMNYANELSPNLIAPKFYGISYNKVQDSKLKKYRLFTGERSAGGSMVGLSYTTGRRIGLADIGLLFGGYIQDSTSFKERRIEPFQLDLGDKYGFVPIFGAELGLKQQLTDKLDLKYNVGYTFVILQFNVSLVYHIGE